jgi:hypothetical protein
MHQKIMSPPHNTTTATTYCIVLAHNILCTCGPTCNKYKYNRNIDKETYATASHTERSLLYVRFKNSSPTFCENKAK